MPRKKAGKADRTTPQLVVRVSEQLNSDLLAAAGGLDLDVSNLVRMVLTEHLGEYIQRGIRARKKLREARAELVTSAADQTGAEEDEEDGTKPVSPARGAPPLKEGKRNLEL